MPLLARRETGEISRRPQPQTASLYPSWLEFFWLLTLGLLGRDKVSRWLVDIRQGPLGFPGSSLFKWGAQRQLTWHSWSSQGRSLVNPTSLDGFVDNPQAAILPV